MPGVKMRRDFQSLVAAGNERSSHRLYGQVFSTRNYVLAVSSLFLLAQRDSKTTWTYTSLASTDSYAIAITKFELYVDEIAKTAQLYASLAPTGF